MKIATKSIPTLSDEDFVRFRYLVDDSNGVGSCWPWTGNLLSNGYGHFGMQKKVFLPHRIAFSIANKEDPKGFCVAHKCDNPSCCNPRHLFKASPQENLDDMVRKGRSYRGEAHYAHVLTESDVRAIRASYVPFLVTYKMLSKRYRVSKRAIMFVVQKRNWKHVQ